MPSCSPAPRSRTGWRGWWLGPTFRFLHAHQILDEFGKVIGYRDLDRIGHTLPPLLIRRRKEEVLHQLPERLEKRFFINHRVREERCPDRRVWVVQPGCVRLYQGEESDDK
jgi:hypothetical protein